MDQTEHEAAVALIVEVAELTRVQRDDLVGRVGAVFARREPRARRYVEALTGAVPRKIGWQIAEHAGDPTPDGVQHLLNRAVWHERQSMGIVADFVVEHPAD